MKAAQYKIEVYIPPEYIDRLRAALNDAGACRVGNYDNCLSVTETCGSWRPLAGSNPYSGMVGELCRRQECRAECRCEAEYVPAAIAAIRRVHPYEEPLINIIPLANNLFE